MTSSPVALCAALALLAGCGDKPVAANGVIQTGYPGQVSAGGATSGQILARNGGGADATYAGGTPGIAGGSGGNTSGAETGGTVQESGQGPSRGATQPSSAGRPGTELQPGDHGGATPPPQRAAPASNAAPGGR